MRFMIIVKASPQSEAGAMPEEALMAAMADYHEQLAKAGVLLDASGLQPSAKGWRIRYSGGKRTVVDGPFAESKELIAGYTIIQVRSRDEALEWTRRFPAPHGDGVDAEIEVRQMFELDDFAPSDAVERFRTLDAANASHGTFCIKRSARIAAPAEKIHALIDDLRQFNTWNPFARKNPSMKIDYRGQSSGPGAAYDFDGGHEMGVGSVEILGSTAPSRVVMKLDMSEPMPCNNLIEFSIVPHDGATEVTWTMSGPNPHPDMQGEQCPEMDSMIGRDFEAGLATLKDLAERRH
jgi:hypothetical protein